MPSPAQGKAKPIKASMGFQGATKPQRFTPDQAAVEALADAALAEAKSPVPVELIRAAIMAAKGPDELAERLSEMYGGEGSAEFQDLVERSIFCADVLGYANAKKRIGGG